MAKKDPHLEMLAGVPLLEGLSHKELRAVNDVAREKTFKPGEELTIEGTKGGRFHVILDGKATVKIGGEPKLTVGAGDSIGEMALIDGGPRTATVVADTPLRTLAIAGFNFRPLLREYPSIAEKLLVVLCRRLREAEQSPMH